MENFLSRIIIYLSRNVATKMTSIIYYDISHFSVKVYVRRRSDANKTLLSRPRPP